MKNKKVITFMLSMAILFPIANIGTISSNDNSMVISAEVCKAENVANTLMDNYDTWNELLTWNDGLKGVTFLDVDLDGELELVVANQQGTNKDTYLQIYKIDTENNSIISINNNEYGYNMAEWGECADIINGNGNLKLYRAMGDNNDMENFTSYRKNDMFYISNDYSGTEISGWVQSVLMKFGTSQSHILKTINYNDTTTYYNFYADGINAGSNNDSSFEITKNEYDTLLNKFYANLEDLNLKYSIVGTQGSVSKEDLIQSYNAFSYDGFTNDNSDNNPDIVDSNNKCGENATWSFNEKSHTLTISGTGAIYDYDAPYFDEDWASKAGIDFYEVDKIVIENGITYIGDYAFAQFSMVNSVTLPNTLTEIGDYAFMCIRDDNGGELPEIIIPSSVTKIGKQAVGFYSIFFNDENGDIQNENKVIENFTIKGYTGSQTEIYAKENNIKFIALDNKVDDSEKNLRNIVENFIPNSLEIIQFCYDDFNKDGVKEAFAVAGVINNKNKSYSDCSIIFVTSNGVEYETNKYDNPNGNGVLPIVGMESSLNKTPINTDSYKFFVWEINNGDSGSTSIIIGYDGKTVFFPYPSHEISTFKQVNKNIVGIEHEFSSGKHKYIDHYYKFDTETMSFVETEKASNDITTEPDGKTITITTTPSNGKNSPPTSDKGVLPIMIASAFLGITAIVTSKKKD